MMTSIVKVYQVVNRWYITFADLIWLSINKVNCNVTYFHSLFPGPGAYHVPDQVSDVVKKNVYVWILLGFDEQLIQINSQRNFMKSGTHHNYINKGLVIISQGWGGGDNRSASSGPIFYPEKKGSWKIRQLLFCLSPWNYISQTLPAKLWPSLILKSGEHLQGKSEAAYHVAHKISIILWFKFTCLHSMLSKTQERKFYWQDFHHASSVLCTIPNCIKITFLIFLLGTVA